MKKEIASNKYYKISVDQEKNRVYFEIYGFWKDPSELPDYLADWKRAIGELKPEFTVLSDIRKMKPHSTSVTPLHEAAQRLLVEEGLDRTAEIMGDAVLLEFQTRQYAEKSSMKKREFGTAEEGEAWLDSEV